MFMSSVKEKKATLKSRFTSLCTDMLHSFKQYETNKVQYTNKNIQKNIWLFTFYTSFDYIW